MEYEKMLERAKAKLPEDEKATERFVVPKVIGHIEGNKTIVSNFIGIADAIRRKPEHLLKYILRELATPGEFRKNAVIFHTKVPAAKINEKIQTYVDEFVLCKECGKPDTKLTKEEGIYFLRCQACGAKHSIYSKI